MAPTHTPVLTTETEALKAIFENVEGAMWLLDTDKRLIIFNHHFTAIYKHIAKQEPVPGLPVYSYLTGSKRQQREDILDTVLSGTKQTLETEYTIKGEIRHFSIAFNPMYDDGIVTGISCYATDITERKLTELAFKQQEAYLHTIFDTTDVAYALFDKELHMLSYNQGAADFAKRNLDTTIKPGDYLSDFFYADRKPMMEMASRGVFAGQRIDVDADFKQADGTMHWYNVRMYPITNSQQEIFGLMLAITDITKRKNIELEREKVTNNLIQRNKDLEQFAYIVSHNLRAPIANIIGFSTELQTEADADMQKVFIDEMAKSVEKVDEVIRDLNEILQTKQQIEENKEAVSFTQMLDEAKAALKNQLFAQNITIEADFAEVDEIFTQSAYMQSIFYNLVSNSVKYRRTEIDTLIRVKSLKKKDSIILSFKDNGMGIDLDKKGHQVFGLYKRFHTNVADGKGMGLYMTKQQTELLGGKISLHSEVNKGTEFYIELPL